MADIYYNLLLALKMVKRHGYRRIGICLTELLDRSALHSARAAASYFNATIPKPGKVVPPLFYRGESPRDWPTAKEKITAWLSYHRPDVIVCHSSQILACVKEAGYRVPEGLGVVHLATDDDVTDWAGVTSNRREMGEIAAELVVSLMQRRQFGVPRTARHTIIRGSWHPGRTLLIPKPE
jgi:LacI family transcriptional regulator